MHPPRGVQAATLAAIAMAVTPAPSGAAPAGLRNTARPVVTGALVAGRVLTARSDRWSRRPSLRRYRWLRCRAGGKHCVRIRRAHRRTYRLRRADVGHRLVVRVTAVRIPRRPSTRHRHRRVLHARARSRPTRVVRAAPAPRPVPTPTPAPSPVDPPVPNPEPPEPLEPFTTPVPGAGLHVFRRWLLAADGWPVQLHGVNYSGTEYACIQGRGIFDGPSDDVAVKAMKAWNVNSVRIGINEDCWLGINGAPAAYSGAAYQAAIADFVDLLHQNGMYAEISLMWAAPGSSPATYQSGGPDADHAPAVWQGMAATFKDDPDVILAPWGETVVDPDCFLHGGVCEATFLNPATGRDEPFAIAGMQQAVDVMRAAGYTGVIAIPGLSYANTMSQWLSHKPVDPSGQLVAEAHLYGGNTCSTVACLEAEYRPVVVKAPLILGEVGEDYNGSCGAVNMPTFLDWADAHDVGYQAWTWNTWHNCSSLISAFDGTPYDSDYARYVAAHYATRP